MKNEKLIIVFAAGLTLLLSYAGYSFLKFKNLADAARSQNLALEIIESIDLKYTDLKFRIRGERPAEAPVALIALDDESLREVGRWPWTRRLVAQVTQNLTDLGASAVGFDVIFSEPEKSDPEADTMMAKTVEKNSDKVILGAFTESEVQYLPYQDYCVNEAFLAAGGDQVIKLNPTLAVDDAEDTFDTLRWNDLFKVLLPNSQALVEKDYLASVGKTGVQELKWYQKNALASEKTKSLYQYCQHWLTDYDNFKISDYPSLRIPYSDLFHTHAELKGLDIEAAIEKFKAQAVFNLVPQHVDWTSNIPAIQEPALFTADFNASLDPDGAVRKYALFYRTGNKIGTSYIPSLALQNYLVSKKYRAEVKLEKNRFGQGIKSVSSMKIFDAQAEPERLVTSLPVDPMGRLPINYYGPRLSLPYVSAKDLLTDETTLKVRYRKLNPATGLYEFRGAGETVAKKEFLNGRSVIIGATAEALYDLRNTPLDKNYPGPEMHLTMLANLLENSFLKKIDNEGLWLPLLMLLMGLGLSWVWSHYSPLVSVSAFVTAGGSIFILDYVLFSRKNILSSAVLLLLEVVIIYGSITVIRYFTEERKKKQLKSTFSRYVSPAIVDEILKEPDNLKLGGRKQRMSVFFSDVRGFTTIAEKLGPQELAQLLNDYLTPMTELVFKNKGTLDKYMGDAIMAFFGAPIFFEDHAVQACRCALENLQKLAELQKEFASKNLPRIDIGIGINTGEMSVGNMGSTIVQNYTVMGDSVNLASRLEGINKEYGTRIIISEFTYQDVKEKFLCREVDRVRVKGKKEPVRIFELIQEGAIQESQKSWLREYEAGYDLYMKKDFSGARSRFEKAHLEAGDPVSRLYTERCEEYQNEPPPENWDGIFEMKTK